MAIVNQKKVRAFKKVMDSAFKENPARNSLMCWATVVRTGIFNIDVMKEAFEQYVDVNDYHPSEKKALLSFRNVKKEGKNNSK